ncbi:MAG: arsenate reductase [Moraxellaceae bacterium]|nr:arsenate reductase [Moraxellaceae bacterium]
MTTIYGIKSCSTMKKAFSKLDELFVDYQFHDYKKQGIDKAKVAEWVEKLGIEKVLNKRGTTWRKLTDEQKATADNDLDYAIDLLVENTSMIKRPIIETAKTVLCGFDEEEINQVFSS